MFPTFVHHPSNLANFYSSLFQKAFFHPRLLPPPLFTLLGWALRALWNISFDFDIPLAFCKRQIQLHEYFTKPWILLSSKTILCGLIIFVQVYKFLKLVQTNLGFGQLNQKKNYYFWSLVLHTLILHPTFSKVFSKLPKKKVWRTPFYFNASVKAFHDPHQHKNQSERIST